MKNIILFTAFVLSTILAKDNTALIKVDGMVCSYSCTGKVSSIVQNIIGVTGNGSQAGIRMIR